MMLRTRCIQCDSSRERQEEFHDISVPVRIEHPDSDDEDGNTRDAGSKQHGLLDLIAASTEVEKLLDDNRYYCDKCKAYTEAERSIHYDVIPNILTLHLKRFSAETNNPGNIFKINDPVTIPLTLPCLRYKCSSSCLRPDHRYKLYGIITHSGVSLTSGHYLSYVRALPQKSVTQSQQVQTQVAQELPAQTVAQPNKDKTSKSGTVTRKKAGVVTKLPSRFTENIVADTKVKAFETVAQKKVKTDMTEQLIPTRRYTSEWFEFDDETVRVFEENEFIELLSGENGALLGTPYLLFYHKATLC